ncbi:hypothetical protein CR513_37149, partial [Mucuna pruriens]
MVLSISTIQLKGHLSSSSTTTSLLEKLATPVTNNSDFVEYDSTNTFAELEQMENNDKTLRSWLHQMWCINLGLSMMDQSMIDVANGGALMDKTPAATRHLISNMANNTQQFGIRGLSQAQIVNEIGAASNQRLENQLIELTLLVRQLAVGQHQPTIVAKVCDICTSVEHLTDLYPTLQETESDQPENVGAIGGYQYGKQPYQSRLIDNQ